MDHRFGFPFSWKRVLGISAGVLAHNLLHMIRRFYV
jgi:hypothetical protein